MLATFSWRKVAGALGEANKDSVCQPGVQPVRLAGNRVGLVHKAGDAGKSGSQNRRRRGEAAHPKNRCGGKFPIKLLATPKAAPKPAGEAEHGGRKQPRHPDGLEFLDSKTVTRCMVAHR